MDLLVFAYIVKKRTVQETKRFTMPLRLPYLYLYLLPDYQHTHCSRIVWSSVQTCQGYSLHSIKQAGPA
jgi:hypothetical protein